jgi:hypothetical protein
MVIPFLSGGVTMALFIAALFFFRFWRKTRNGLFMSFGFAFLLLASSQTIVTLLRVDEDRSPYAYIPRVAGYMVILYAIVRTNVPGRRVR